MTTVTTTNAAPRWWRPAICWPWRVEWSTVPAVAPAILTPDDPLWGWFVQDLFLAEHPEGYCLDLGWYPDTSPLGAFVLELRRADEVLEQLETRDLDAITEAILCFSRRYARPVPASAGALLAGLAGERVRAVLPALFLEARLGLLTEAAEQAAEPELAIALLRGAIQRGELSARILAEQWLNDPAEQRALVGLQVLRAVDDQAASDAMFRRLCRTEVGAALRGALATALGEMHHPPHTGQPGDAGQPLPGSLRLVRVALGLSPDAPGDDIDAGPLPLAPIQRKLAEQPERAASLLVRLADLGEPRAVDTLLLLLPAGLDSDLRRWAEGADPAVAAAARRALAQLAPSAAASATLAQNLHCAGPVEQLLAVDLLVKQSDAVAAAALLDALLVDDFFIRTSAWDGLIARTGLAPTTGADDFGPLSALHLRVLTSLKTIWHPAAARARGLFRRLLDGEAAAAVIPAYLPGDPARRALALDALRQGGEAPIDISILRSLAGHDRAWFEAALLSRVGRQEPRAIDAAAALEIGGLVGALQEAAKRWAPMSDEVQTAVARALQSVGRPR